DSCKALVAFEGRIRFYRVAMAINPDVIARAVVLKKIVAVSLQIETLTLVKELTVMTPSLPARGKPCARCHTGIARAPMRTVFPASVQHIATRRSRICARLRTCGRVINL